MAFLLLILSAASVYAVDDDSTPYMPFPAQQPQTQQPKSNTTKKAPVKKKTTKKKVTKKAPAKKTTSKKAVAPKITSLERGIALMKEDRYEAAKPYLLKAIQENRNDPNAWYWYGVYHEKTGGYYQAQYFYSKAVTIDPAFEPLSRVVYYPNDSEKTPLWDPKRPARVYPVATANNDMTIAGRGNFPSAPNDPEIPKVPVYTPPEPGSNPLDGDSWAPAVYVPPNPDELPIREGTSPVYTPPQVQSVVAEAREDVRLENYTYKIPGYSNTYVSTNENSNVRADLPLYNPPEPGQRIAQAPAPQTEVKKAQPKVATKETQPKTAPRKVVKQSDKKKTPTKKTTQKNQAQTQEPAKKTQERQTQPRQQTQTQIQPQRQSETERRQQEQTRPQTPQVQPKQQAPEPEITQPERRQSEYLPPVGQFAPDPGTVSEGPIPPVGQGAQY